MKNVLGLLLLCCLLISTHKTVAQVNINIQSQPVWGPIGYDHVDYYYIPDIDIYYSVPQHKYVYLSNNRWVFNTAPPAQYINYNFYNGYKVVLNGPRPYLQHKAHKVKYVGFKGNNHNQGIIKNSKEAKYFVVKGHPNHVVKTKMGKPHSSKGKGNNGNAGKKKKN
jgi:hypothetical protein